MPSLNLCLRSNWFVCCLEDRGHRIQAYVELAIRWAEPVRETPALTPTYTTSLTYYR